MYQGVLRDEERVQAKALALLSPTSPTSPSSSSSSASSIAPPSTSPEQLQFYSTPLNTPSSPVQQPAPVLDEDCKSCIISPPPQLLESQSAEERAKEREERKLEYEMQKGLGDKLGRAQGVQMDREV